MTSWFDEAADLLIGARCPGCGCPGPRICRRCAALLRPVPALVELAGAPMPVVAAGPYRGIGERVVRHWKDLGHKGAARWAAHAIAAGVVHLGVHQPLLVPVPTTRRARRRRGTWLVDDLARDAAALLAQTLGVDASVAHLARLRRQTRDQRRLGLRQRAQNTRGAFAARPAFSQRPVLVIDDVVTTGATLYAVAGALEQSGWQVLAGVTALATPPPSLHRSSVVEEPGEG